MKILAGKYKGKKLFSPNSKAIRPTLAKTKETLFNILGPKIEGASFLDLFAGGGGVGCEALSRGAHSVLFVDKNRDAIQTVRQNIDLLNAKEQCNVFPMAALTALMRLVQKKQRFDIIFADPPYGKGLSAELLTFFDTHSILNLGGVLLLEDTYKTDLDSTALTALELVSERRIGKTYLWEYHHQASPKKSGST